MSSFISQLWSLGLEAEMINNRHVEKLVTNDPVLAGMGGACVFIYTAAMKAKAEKFLKAAQDGDERVTLTNNPTLIQELQEVVKNPPDTYLALFSTALRERCTPGEFEAVVQHEYGHVNHRHLEGMRFGGYDEFITNEKEADNYAVTKGQANIDDMINGLEKAMKFGAEQAVLWQAGVSNSFIRKLFDSQIIDAMAVKFVTRMSRSMHGARFKTLEALKKERAAAGTHKEGQSQ